MRQNPRAQIGSRITGLKTQLSPPSPKQSFAYNRMSTGRRLNQGVITYNKGCLFTALLRPAKVQEYAWCGGHPGAMKNSQKLIWWQFAVWWVFEKRICDCWGTKTSDSNSKYHHHSKWGHLRRFAQMELDSTCMLILPRLSTTILVHLLRLLRFFFYYYGDYDYDDDYDYKYNYIRICLWLYFFQYSGHACKLHLWQYDK